MVERTLQEIVEPLLRWYEENARPLPWRESTDPYRVWLSEIMLQQTRVEAVKPYFERFLRRLPTVRHLAEVPEDELLKLWEGLGYYSRARNLKKAAQIICSVYGGIFPDSYAHILALPGIGPYTAGAVCSIAFELPTPAVDGNVLRVITRLTENRLALSDPQLKKGVTEKLIKIYPAGRCGDFTQGLMELGATVCLPNRFPKCGECPLSLSCQAYGSGTQLSYPVKAKKQPRKKQVLTVFLLSCSGLVAVQKREAAGLLHGLWEFPNTEGALTEPQACAWLQGRGLSVREVLHTAEQKHIFTHIEWQMHGYRAECSVPAESFTWVSEEELAGRIALPTAFKKFLPCF